jgi:hypothetical protein
MPTRPILADASFSAETTAMLGEAFDLGWARLTIDCNFPSDANSALARELLAMRILYLAPTGENNRDHIIARAIAFVTDHFNPPPKLRAGGSFQSMN